MSTDDQFALQSKLVGNFHLKFTDIGIALFWGRGGACRHVSSLMINKSLTPLETTIRSLWENSNVVGTCLHLRRLSGTCMQLRLPEPCLSMSLWSYTVNSVNIFVCPSQVVSHSLLWHWWSLEASVVLQTSPNDRNRPLLSARTVPGWAAWGQMPRSNEEHGNCLETI